MKRWLMMGIVTEVTFLFWLLSAAPVFGGSAVTGGARKAADGEAGRAIRGGNTLSSPSSFQEVTAAFTASPTSGSLGDAVEASRITFSTTETIEFNAILFESGLAGNTVNLQLYLLNQAGMLVAPPFLVNGVLAPDDLTGFFIQLSPGSVPAGRLKWAMVIIDAAGNLFVTPFEALNVQ